MVMCITDSEIHDLAWAYFTLNPVFESVCLTSVCFIPWLCWNMHYKMCMGWAWAGW